MTTARKVRKTDVEAAFPGHVLVPRDRYDRLIAAAKAAEAAHDRKVAEEAVARGDFLPLELARRIFNGESPLRIFRLRRGLTQEALAGRVGVAKSYLSHIENGRRKGTVDVLRRCAVALEVDLDDLVLFP